jgi:hypothetical protein
MVLSAISMRHSESNSRIPGFAICPARNCEIEICPGVGVRWKTVRLTMTSTVLIRPVTIPAAQRRPGFFMSTQPRFQKKYVAPATRMLLPAQRTEDVPQNVYAMMRL